MKTHNLTSVPKIDRCLAKAKEDGATTLETIERLKKLTWSIDRRNVRWSTSGEYTVECILKLVPDNTKLIRLTNSLGHVFTMEKTGKTSATFSGTNATSGKSETFTSEGWGYNSSRYERLANHSVVQQFLGLLFDAILDVRKKEILRLRKSLGTEDLAAFQAAKEAERTSAMIELAMAAGKLMSELEAYQKNIISVDSLDSAQKLASKIESSMQSFQILKHSSYTKLRKHFKPSAAKTVARLMKSEEKKAQRRAKKEAK